jgi:hypothetical protein
VAAITVKLGVQSDVSELESEVLSLSPEEAEAALGEPETSDVLGLGTIGRGAVDEAFDTTGLVADVMNKTHAEQVQMASMRRVVAESLAGVNYTVRAVGREIYIELDRGVGLIPAWNPPTNAGIKRFALLSWTSKMGTPSFSLPAGAAVSGGTCPGATAGQSIVPAAQLRAAARGVVEVIGRPVRLDQAVCQYCYATGGQYATGQVQFAQVLRYIWVRQALADGTFVPTMTWAVDHANYYLDGTGKMKEEVIDPETGTARWEKIPAPRERDQRRYFRLHDSGDFFSPQYLAAWKQVTLALPDITFWAPSRVWTMRAFCDAVNEINNPPANLIIRPSAFHTNEIAPRDLGPGWAQGSVVYSDSNKPGGGKHPRLTDSDRPYDWDCQAYTTENDHHTCRSALAPDGESGCRACWRHPDAEICYTLH